MELLRQILLVIHILGFAALIGGLIVQVGSPERVVNAAMRDGVGTAFLAGIALVGVLEADGQDVDNAKIAVKGLTLMRGYYKVDPEATFDADGYYHSADGGFLDAAGYVHWKGRISNLIKTGGANVSPMEIEESLLGFPNMRTGIPFGAPHPTLGEVIVLCAVAIEGHTLRESEILDFLRGRLAVYKLPRKVLMFTEADLDFTGNQKIQVNKLVEKALARLRDEAVVIDGINYGEFLTAPSRAG